MFCFFDTDAVVTGVQQTVVLIGADGLLDAPLAAEREPAPLYALEIVLLLDNFNDPPA